MMHIICELLRKVNVYMNQMVIHETLNLIFES